MKLLRIVFLAACVFFVSSEAHAYPWMIRHGYTSCSGCHTDPSGGELLTLYGHAISWEALSTRWGGEEAPANAAIQRRIASAVSKAAVAKNAPAKKKPAPEADEEAEEEEAAEDEEAEGGESADEALDSEEVADEEGEPDETQAAEDAGEAAASTEPSPFEGMGALTGPLLGLGPVSDNLLLGASVRLASIYYLDADGDKFRFFPMQLDAYGQARFGSLRFSASIGAAKVPAGSPHARPAQLTRNQGDGYNVISRTHWVGYDFGDGAHLIRAGRMNLPFGLRMSEHVMWVRERTQTDRESDQQHGVALYMGFETLRFELMGILGNYQVNPDAFRERGYAGYLEFIVAEKTAVGLSSLYTFAKDDRLEPQGLTTMRQAHGPFVRWSPTEALAFMGEFDVLLRSRRDMGYVGMLQLDLEPAQGFHVIATGELLDNGFGKAARIARTPRSAGQGRPQGGGWLSLQWFFLPHFDLRVDLIKRDDTQIFSQLHVYL